MEQVVLKAQPRDVIGKQVRALRRAGLVPAVIYGHNFEPVAISLNHHEASRAMPHISSSQLITVDVNGTQHNVLVREKQRHPVTGSLLHVDFLAVSMTEKLHVMVALEFTGDAPAVKIYNGIVATSREQVEVEALPADLPSSIVVDLSVLTGIGSSILVRDLNVPAKVTVLNDPDEVLVVITAQAGETDLVAGGMVEPEVIEKGKKDEEDF